MSPKITSTLVALGADLLAEFGVPGGNVLGQSINKLFEKRLAQAREILVEELRSGERVLSDVAEVEEAAAIIYRYSRAAQEGAARLNLRLMAKAIAGQARIGKLVADEFLYHAHVLASLRREEVILVATMYRNAKSPELRALDENERDGAVRRKTKEDLVPSLFGSDEELEAAAGAMLRTGLIVGASGWGSIVYLTSPLMDQLARLVSFDDALREEGIDIRHR